MLGRFIQPYSLPKSKADAGFTLLEIIVTIIIMMILTFLVASAFPAVREGQSILKAEHLLQVTVRSAQIQALDERRDQECLDQVGTDKVLRKQCSDVGVHLVSDKVITFADTSDDNTYSQDDYKIAEVSLPFGVTVSSATTFLFEATPPSVSLYVDGVLVDAANHGEVTLVTSQSQNTYGVYPYGQFQKL